jgi:hypothetical protein
MLLSFRTYFSSKITIIFLTFGLLALSSTGIAKPSWKDEGSSEQSNKGSGKGGGKNKTQTPVSDITIIDHPSSLSIMAGDSATFSVSANSSDGQAIIYQWHLNGSIIVGENTSSLLIEDASLSDQGEYSLSLNTPDVTKTTQAFLSVEEKPEPIIAVNISLHPVSQSAYIQEDLTLNVSATGSGAITYQWRKDGVALSGENQSYLNFSSLSLSDNALYDVIVSNEAGSVTSSAATLTVKEFSSIALSWETPAAREDSTQLNLNEIDSYVIYLSYDVDSPEETITIPATLNSIVFDDMPPGDYQLAIATTDVSGLTGERSEKILLSIN